MRRKQRELDELGVKVAVVTFQKRHIVLFVLGFLIPFLWLIGAMLPGKPGSTYRGPMA